MNHYIHDIRERIAEIWELDSPFKGEVEIDESYFGVRHQKGKRGRGATGKTIVFGIYKRNGKVYTEIVPDVIIKTLQAIISGKIEKDSVIHSDKWRAYNGLVDLCYKKHYRFDHVKSEYVNGKSHIINGIEGICGFAESRLSKFKSMKKERFFLHLKECEFRFNFRNENLYQMLLNILKEKSLN